MSEPKFTKGPWTSSLMDYHSEDPTVIAISKSWTCPNCGAQDPEHISLIDGLAFRCPVCRLAYIFTSFDEAYKNGWGRNIGLNQYIEANSGGMNK